MTNMCHNKCIELHQLDKLDEKRDFKIIVLS